MAARDIKIGTAMDALAWAREAIVAAAGTSPGSPERRRKLDEIALGIARAKQMAEAYRGRMAAELRIAVSVAELGINKLRNRGRGEAEPASSRSDGETGEARGTKRKIHPRLRAVTGRDG